MRNGSSIFLVHPNPSIVWCEHIQTVFRVSPGPDSGPGQRRRTRARPGTSSRSHGQINLSLFSAQPRSDAQPLAEARGAEHRSSAPVRPLVKFTLLTCAPLQRHSLDGLLPYQHWRMGQMQRTNFIIQLYNDNKPYRFPKFSCFFILFEQLTCT